MLGDTMEYLIRNINNVSKEQLNSFYKEIPILKKEKIDKYKNENTKIRSIVGELLLKELLSNKNVKYSNISYYINDYGKPYLKNEKYFFNISHSYDYVITSISTKEIGIDIEKVRKSLVKTINQFATNNEKEYILSSKDNIEERLFEIYTLKEAYFKMKGTNLNHILEIEFIINNNKIICSDKSVEVGFIKDIKNYIIAYCIKKS